MDNQISLSGLGWGRWSSGAGVAPGNRPKSRDDDPCRSDQSGSRAPAAINPALFVSVSFGTISQRQELAQAVDGVPSSAKALLGPASMGQGILGRFKRERNRRGVEEIHRGPEARRARRRF